MEWRARVDGDAARLIPTQHRVTEFARRIDERLGDPALRGRTGYSSSAFLTHIDNVMSAPTEAEAERALVVASNYVHGSAQATLSSASDIFSYMKEKLLVEYRSLEKFGKRQGQLTYVAPDTYLEKARELSDSLRAAQSTLPAPQNGDFLTLLEDGLSQLDRLYSLALEVEGKTEAARKQRLEEHNEWLTAGNLVIAVLGTAVAALAILVAVVVADPTQYSKLRKLLHFSEGPKPGLLIRQV